VSEFSIARVEPQARALRATQSDLTCDICEHSRAPLRVDSPSYFGGATNYWRADEAHRQRLRIGKLSINGNGSRFMRRWFSYLSASAQPQRNAITGDHAQCILKGAPARGASHQRCDLKKPRAKPWVDYGKTVSPLGRNGNRNVAPIGLRSFEVASIPRAKPWAISGRTFGATNARRRVRRALASLRMSEKFFRQSPFACLAAFLDLFEPRRQTASAVLIIKILRIDSGLRQVEWQLPQTLQSDILPPSSNIYRGAATPLGCRKRYEYLHGMQDATKGC
jgi:hypothetical protein